jgi:hypothetical protein
MTVEYDSRSAAYLVMACMYYVARRPVGWDAASCSLVFVLCVLQDEISHRVIIILFLKLPQFL